MSKEEHQFKPGVSGNPAGKPKGAQSIGTIFRKLLDGEVTVKELNKQKRVTRTEALALKLFSIAHENEARCPKCKFPIPGMVNIKAIQEIFDRAFGKPPQKMDMGLESIEKMKFKTSFGEEESD